MTQKYLEQEHRHKHEQGHEHKAQNRRSMDSKGECDQTLWDNCHKWMLRSEITWLLC